MIAAQVSHQRLVADESAEQLVAATPDSEIYSRVIIYHGAITDDLAIESSVAFDDSGDEASGPSWLEQMHPLLAALVGATGALMVGVCKQRRYDAEVRENFGKLE